MAAITVTAANVQKTTSSSTEHVRYGGTVTAGMGLYQDATDGYDWKPAIATSVAASAAKGISLNSGSDGQPGEVITNGLYNPGGTVVVGQVYCVSAAAAGGIVPYSDLASGEFVTILGVGITAASILVDIIVSGIAKP